MKTIFLLLSWMSFATFAQNETQVISEKMKPLIFQVEKQLASQVKATLEESLKIKDSSVRASLKIDHNVVARKYDLVAKKNKFYLPGLDESASNVEENLKNFNPTIQDVYSAVTELNLKIGTLVLFTDSEKEDVEKVVADDLSTLNLKRISYSYTKSKNLEPIEPQIEKAPEPKVEAAPAPAPAPVKAEPVSEVRETEDYSQWFLIGGLALGFLLIGSIVLVGFLVARQFKNMSNSLSGAISQIDVNNSGSVQASSSQNALTGEVVRNSSEESYGRIKMLISQISNKADFYKTFLTTFSGVRFYVICECLNPQERDALRRQLNSFQNQEYLLFLQAMARGEVSPSVIALETENVSREMNLYVHDANTFVEEVTKNKIRKLNNESLRHLIDQSDEEDFMTLAQISDPLAMSVLLNENPDILERFDALEVWELNSDRISSLTHKIDSASSHLPPQMGGSHELKLREFVPVNIEQILNQKLGKEKTLWEELDDEGMVSLYDFTMGLPPKEASLFVSIIPDDLRDDVLSHIPELKRNQIRRHGFEVSKRSMELKHEFFQTLRS